MNAVKKSTLIMFDTKNNCNKFYDMTLDYSGQIIARYGRVGTKGQRKIYSGGESKFFNLLNEKRRKGYREAAVENNDADKSSVKKGNAIDAALEQIVYKDDESKELIKRVASANIHNIVGNTNITYDKDDGLFKTPLGVIRKEAVVQSIKILDKIEALVESNIDVYSSSELEHLNTEYFYRIPNKINNARNKDLLLYNIENIKEQRNICSSLIETLDLLNDLKSGKKELDKEAEKNDMPKVFDVNIQHIKDKEMFDKINNLYEKSKNGMHGHRVKNSVVKNIYAVSLGSQREAFKKSKKDIGNVHLLWHGTRAANTLSIMSKGLLMPTVTPGKKIGAMFGDGLYFANQSSKSLQYCDGLFWGQGGSLDTIYLFLASVAVGKAEIPSGVTNKKPRSGYDSYWAKANKSGVRNDEIIVFKPEQVRLDYLLEIKI